MMVSIGLSITNTMFYFWIMKALEETKKKLQEKNQMIKYKMMRHFTFMLAFVYIAGAATIFGDIYLKYNKNHDERWRHEWLVEASWEMIFTLFVFSVMMLMRPSEKSKMLAYIEEIGDENASQTRDHNTAAAAEGSKREDIEMVEMENPTRKQSKKLEKQKLDSN
jgi:hypothetical protein